MRNDTLPLNIHVVSRFMKITLLDSMLWIGSKRRHRRAKKKSTTTMNKRGELKNWFVSVFVLFTTRQRSAEKWDKVQFATWKRNITKHTHTHTHWKFDGKYIYAFRFLSFSIDSQLLLLTLICKLFIICVYLRIFTVTELFKILWLKMAKNCMQIDNLYSIHFTMSPFQSARLFARLHACSFDGRSMALDIFYVDFAWYIYNIFFFFCSITQWIFAISLLCWVIRQCAQMMDIY